MFHFVDHKTLNKNYFSFFIKHSLYAGILNKLTMLLMLNVVKIFYFVIIKFLLNFYTLHLAFVLYWYIYP